MKINTLAEFTWRFFCARLFKLKSPLLVGFSLTKHCFFHCQYCFFSSNNEEDLSLAEIKNIVDKLCSCGMLIIQFTGGEPCLRNDLAEIVEYTKNKKVRFIILSTSGYNIQEHERALKYIDLVHLSLDGDRQTHDKLRGIGSFDIVTSAAEFLKSKGKKFYFRTVLSALNLDTLENVIAIAENYQTKVMFQPLWFGENAIDSNLNLLVSKENLLNNALGKLIHLKNKTNAIGNSFFALKLFKSLPKMNSCVAGKIFFRVESNGDLQHCCRKGAEFSQFNLNQASKKEFENYLMGRDDGFCLHTCLDSSLVELNGFYNLNPMAISAIFDYWKSIK